MATSGTSTFNRNRDQIISRAARLVGAIHAGETPNAVIVQDFTESLNSMVKRWAATSTHVWTVEEATLFVQPGQVQYGLGSASTDHVTQSYTATTLASAAASGAGSIVVSSASGFAASRYVGVVLDDGTLFWTTESGAPSGTTITLAASLTGAAAAGNAVYVYQTKIVRPLRIPAARRYNFSSAIDTDLGRPVSNLDYRGLPNKTVRGAVNQFFYDPRGGATALGQLYLWPAPDSVGDAIRFTWHRPIQDAGVAGDNPDFPEEWIDPLVFNLAESMAPEFDVPEKRFAMIRMNAAKYLDEVQGSDQEQASAMFAPDC